MRQNKAFTLLELLVVMAIMGTSLALVRPLVFDQVDKTKANAELKQLQQLIDSTASIAYLSGQPVNLKFNGKSLLRELGKKTALTDFEFLFFEPQSFSINSNGQLPSLTLELTSHRKTVRLPIGEPQE